MILMHRTRARLPPAVMRRSLVLVLATASAWTHPMPDAAAATEEPPYDLRLADHEFEVRDYATRTVAETHLTGAFDSVGDRAFGRLFDYISGDNSGREKIAMTAPVSQVACDGAAREAPREEAPGACWTVRFAMPAAHDLASLPSPARAEVRLRELAPARFAVVRYAGVWSERLYRRHEQRLRAWMREQGYAAGGPPIWARYNAPFTPWFMRRNEVMIPIDATGSP